MVIRPKTNHISNVTPVKSVIHINFLCGITVKKSCSPGRINLPFEVIA